MKELIQNGEVKDNEADLWMTSMAFIAAPTKEMLADAKVFNNYILTPIIIIMVIIKHHFQIMLQMKNVYYIFTYFAVPFGLGRTQ